MASTIIHMAVANEINKVLKRNDNQLLIGSISPDVSKLVGETKLYSHFLDSDDTDIPNIDRFLERYKDNLNDDFVLGYFIHLYTDYLWFKYFVPEVFDEVFVTKLDGTKIRCTGNMIDMYIYNDYTNMNEQLIEKYNLDLKIFYVRSEHFNNIIKEIPMDKLDLILDKTIEIIENTKVKKDLVLDIKNIEKFIRTATELTVSKLKELEVIK